MNINKRIIITILFLAVLVTGAGYLSMSNKNIETKNILDNYYVFNNFPKGTIIKTEVINASGLGYSYQSLKIEKDKEKLKEEHNKDNLYNGSYDIFYQIQKPKEKTIDILLSTNNKNNFSVTIKDTNPKVPISIENNHSDLYKKIPTDWSGNIKISNINMNKKICISIGNYNNKDQQICYINNQYKGDVNA